MVTYPLAFAVKDSCLHGILHRVVLHSRLSGKVLVVGDRVRLRFGISSCVGRVASCFMADLNVISRAKG